MILDMLYLVGFVIFIIDLVIIWIYWFSSISLNSTTIFFILNKLKFWLIFLFVFMFVVVLDM